MIYFDNVTINIKNEECILSEILNFKLDDCGAYFLNSKKEYLDKYIYDLLTKNKDDFLGSIYIDNCDLKEISYETYFRNVISIVDHEEILKFNFLSVTEYLNLNIKFDSKLDKIFEYFSFDLINIKKKISELSEEDLFKLSLIKSFVSTPKIVLIKLKSFNGINIENLLFLIKKLAKTKLILIFNLVESSFCFENQSDNLFNKIDFSFIENEDDFPPIAKSKNRKNISIFQSINLFKSYFKTKIFTFLSVILLLACSFTSFNYYLNAIFYDPISSQLDLAYEKECETVFINAVNYYSYEAWADFRYVNSSYEKEYYFVKTSTDKLSLKNSTNLIYDSLGENTPEFTDYVPVNYGNLTYEKYLNPYYFFSIYNNKNFIQLNPSTGENDACLEKATSESRLPINENEIAITDYLADIILKVGYIDYDSNKENTVIENFNSFEEILGKTIFNRKITGIFKTEERIDKLKEYDIDYDGEFLILGLHEFLNENPDLYNFVNSDHIARSFFVYLNEDNLMPSKKALFKLSGDKNDDLRNIKSLIYEEEIKRGASCERNIYSCYITSPYSKNLDLYEGFTNSNIQIIFIILSLLFLISGIIIVLKKVYFNGTLKHNFKKFYTSGISKKNIDSMFVCTNILISVVSFLIGILISFITYSIISFIIGATLFTLTPHLLISFLVITVIYVFCTLIIQKVSNSKNIFKIIW